MTSERIVRAVQAGARKEVVFALCLEECLKTGEVTIDLMQRPVKQDGEYGRCKELPARANDAPDFLQGRDGKLVEILCNIQADARCISATTAIVGSPDFGCRRREVATEREATAARRRWRWPSRCC